MMKKIKLDKTRIVIYINNMSRHRRSRVSPISNAFAISLFCISLFLSMPVCADFVVKSEYQSPLPYGNAETVCFHNMIAGRPLTPEEERALMARLPEKEEGRFYGRIRVNSGLLVLSNLRNRSGAPYATQGIVTKRGSKTQTGIELAIGYIWDRDFRGDIEYLVNRNFNFSANPVFTNIPSQLSVVIRNNTLLANAYYDFDFERFRPYLTGGIGLAANTVTSTLTPPPAIGGQNTQRFVSFAWQLGVGFRVSVFTRWFVDVSYRFIGLGSNVRISPNNNFKIIGNYGMSAISAGVIYLF